MIATQVRLPDAMHSYIKQEAERIGVSQNAMLTILLDRGRKMWEWEADINASKGDK